MDTAEKIMVVVDPTQSEHVALERLLITSRLREVKPEVKIFIGVDGSASETGANNPAMYRDAEWFVELFQPLIDEGLNFTRQVCWSPDWQQAIVRSAEEFGADLIFLSDMGGHKLSDGSWFLLRNAKCPVVLVRPGADSKRKTVLAAVCMQGATEEQQALNTRVLERGRWIADHYGAAFHVVNAYPDSMEYPDRSKLLREANVEQGNIHVEQGDPDKVIAEAATQLDADIVVIGTRARQGLALVMRGNTSELVIKRLSQDVLTLN